MEHTPKHTCQANVWRGPNEWHMRLVPCGRTAKIEDGGKWYCGTHDPIKRKEREDAAEKNRRISVLNRDYVKLKRDRDALLAALKATRIWAGTILSLYPSHERDGGNVRDDVAAIDAAIAQAERED